MLATFLTSCSSSSAFASSCAGLPTSVSSSCGSERPAAVVHDDDGLGRRSSMAYDTRLRMPVTVARCQRRAPLQLEHDGRLRRRAVLREERLLAHRDVHPRGADLVDGRDRPRDLALEGAPVVDLLEELGGAEVGPVEDLEADAADRGQSLAGEVEPQLVDRPSGTRTAATALRQLVRHLRVP